MWKVQYSADNPVFKPEATWPLFKSSVVWKYLIIYPCEQ